MKALATALVVVGCGTEFSTLGLSLSLPDGGAPNGSAYDAYVPGAGGRPGGSGGAGDSGGVPGTGGIEGSGGASTGGGLSTGGSASGGLPATGGAIPTGGASSGGTGAGGAPLDACVPKSCDEQGRTCGGGTDLCGHPLHCGLCPSGERCEQGKCVCAPSGCPFCVFGPACCTAAGTCGCPPNGCN